jgi:hypothetical protein
MHWLFSLYVAFLFFILTPAILVRLPPKAGKFTVAGFHAVVFGLILHFTGKTVWNFARSLEGFQEGNTTCKQNSKFTGNDLNTPNELAKGDQSCPIANKEYCDALIYDKKPKGHYTYDKNQKPTECVVNVKQSASSTTADDALKRAVTGFIQQCQKTMKGTPSVADPKAYNNEPTITCTGMTATEKDIDNTCKGSSQYNKDTKVCTWTKK